MKLQTKLMLGFSVVLFMVLTLGGTSYYLTETMSHFSGQAGYIENGKTALLNTQTAYLRFIVYGDDSFAQRSLEQLAEAKKQLDLCLPMIVNPENKQKMTACINGLEATLPLLQQSISDQKESIRLLQNDQALMDLVKAFDAMETIIYEGILAHGADRINISNQKNVEALRIEFNRLRAEVRGLSLRSTRKNWLPFRRPGKILRAAMLEQADRFGSGRE